MMTQTTGLVIDGQLKLDQPLRLPNNTAVTVMVKVDEGIPADWRGRFEAGLADMLKLMKDRPIHSGGLHFSREELHERR